MIWGSLGVPEMCYEDPQSWNYIHNSTIGNINRCNPYKQKLWPDKQALKSTLAVSIRTLKSTHSYYAVTLPWSYHLYAQIHIPTRESSDLFLSQQSCNEFWMNFSCLWPGVCTSEMNLYFVVINYTLYWGGLLYPIAMGSMLRSYLK